MIIHYYADITYFKPKVGTITERCQVEHSIDITNGLKTTSLKIRPIDSDEWLEFNS